jgi:hypothetical protein
MIDILNLQVEHLVVMFVLSLVLQTAIGSLRFKNLINPVTLLNLLFLVHNWSYSLGSLFEPAVRWNAPQSVDYATQIDVLAINLVSLWVMFFILLLSRAKARERSNYTKILNVKLLVYLYFIFTAAHLCKLYFEGSLSGIYGDGQSLNSKDSFSPILMILMLRVVFASIYAVIRLEKNVKITFFIIATEILVTLLTGDRKELVIISLCFLIPNLEYIKLSGLKIVKYLTIFIFVGYFVVFISIFRGTMGETTDLQARLSVSQERLQILGKLAFFHMLYTANSEGVQNWTYQLLESGEMDHLYGLSYVQAASNMVLLRPLQGPMVNWQAAYHFKSVAYPHVTNQGWDFTFTAEAILNWGKYFAFVSYGVLAFMIMFFYRNRGHGDLFKVLYYMTWPLLFIHLRTDSTSLLRMYSFILFVYVLIYLCGSVKTILRYPNQQF